MRYQFDFPKYKLWNYEKVLCTRMVKSLAEGEINHFIENSLELKTDSDIPSNKLEKLSYFDRVLVEKNGEKEEIFPRQNLFERAENTQELDIQKIKKTKNNSKQSRYLVHGLHEYKGKYYPQLVTSILNIIGATEDDSILDPFCGCGTTLLESKLHSMNSVGIDINPFAVYFFNTLKSSFSVNLEKLKSVSKKISFPNSALKSEKNSKLPEENYLSKWFDKDVFNKLRTLRYLISDIEDEDVRRILNISLSDILRTVSHQDTDQIRVRREKNPPDDPKPIERFKEKLNENIKSIEKLQYFSDVYNLSRYSMQAYEKDVKKIDTDSILPKSSIDHIIFSPPYATGLPYVDTYRLSLFFLGLLEKSKRRELENEVIGNREISDGKRKELEKEFLDNYSDIRLPNNVKSLIKEIHEANKEADVGFRRKNKSALLYRYFRDMRDSLNNLFDILKGGGFCVMVVGRNSTKIGDNLRKVKIPTDDFLYDIGEMIGFEKNMVIDKELDSTSTREVHNHQAIKNEKILFLKKSKKG